MEIDRINSQPPRQPGQAESLNEQAHVRQTDRLPRGLEQAHRVQESDSVEISDRARELARLQQAVEDAADVRADKVAKIKKQVETGTYSVPIELLAERLLGGEEHGRS